MSFKVTDKVVLRTAFYDLIQKTYPHDSILTTSCYTVYKILELSEECFTIYPEDRDRDIRGNDCKPYDKTTRVILKKYWVDQDLDKTIAHYYNPNVIYGTFSVGAPVSQNNGPMFCSCQNPIVVKNYALHQEFSYCKACKKERK